jgi:hypothetical protein
MINLFRHFKKLDSFMGHLFGKRAVSSADVERVRARTDQLVRALPQHLAEHHYELNHNESEVEELFQRVRTTLYKFIHSKQGAKVSYTPLVRTEQGKMTDKRSYFYLEPWSDSGWLFERTTNGWVIAPADKIVGQNTFFRQGAWDVINVMSRNDNNGMFRLMTKNSGSDLVSLHVYEESLKRFLEDKLFTDRLRDYD